MERKKVHTHDPHLVALLDGDGGVEPRHQMCVVVVYVYGSDAWTFHPTTHEIRSLVRVSVNRHAHTQTNTSNALVTVHARHHEHAALRHQLL